MKKFLFKRTAKITVSALLIFSVLCTMFSVIAVTDITKDNPLLSYNAVTDIAQAQTDSTYSLAYNDILAQETAAAEAYSYSYDSVTAVQDGITAEVLNATYTWHFGRQNVVKNDETGLYLPDGEVNDQAIWKQSGWYSSSSAVRNANAGMLYVWDSGEGEGLGVYNSKVFTFVGYKTGHASVLTFQSPETGKIHLHSATVTGLTGETFLSLQNPNNYGDVETVGVAVYKNNEKVWPVDSDYSVISHSVTSVTIPDISIEVVAGDKVYYKLIPLTEEWGYYTLNPKITYQRIGEAVDYAWSYSEKAIALDETTGYYLPTGDWLTPEIYHQEHSSDASSDKIPNYLTKKDWGNAGYGTYDGEVITFVGSAEKGNAASTITYTAPKDGVVALYDMDEYGKNNSAVYGNITPTFWGLSAGGGGTMGVAIYKNNEKIYPADADYLEVTAAVQFPALSGIDIKAGDKLHIMFIPLAVGYTYIRFSPQIKYQTIGTETSSVWSYSAKNYAKDETTGYNLPAGDWYELLLAGGSYPADTAAVTAKNPNFMYSTATNMGIGVDTDGKLVSYVGTGRNGKVVALTFTAPIAGAVRLYDPTGGTMGSAGIGNPYWTLHENNGDQIGVVIYKNNEKLWPADKDYYTLDYNARTVAFPDLNNISVAAGDQIRIAFIPISCDWAYVKLAPQIDYLETTYSSAADAVAYQETKALWSTFNDTLWSYEEKAIEQTSVEVDGTATDLYMPVGDWASTPKFEKGDYCNRDGAVRNALPNMFYYWGGDDTEGSGLATYEGRVVTYIGHGNDAAPTLTYTAPLKGKINISSDDLVGRIENSTFDTLHEGGMIGFAIYKNNDKIWPAEGEIGDFHVFHGKIWENGVYTFEGNVNMKMPELDVEVAPGDKIRFMFVPMDEHWGFMALDPHIQYTAVDGWNDNVTGISVDAPTVRKYFAVEEYDFSDMAVNLLKADGTSSVLAAGDYVVTAPKEIGRNSITVQYTENGITYKRSFDVTVLETLYGDLNADGLVDVSDLTNLRKYLLGLDPDIHISVANVKDDDAINIIDLIRMKKHLADSAVILGPVTD